MDAKENIEVEKPRGRSSILEAYKSAYPDNTEEPNDEALHDFSDKRYSELEGKYKNLYEPNVRLSELISKDPRLGAVLSMISGEKPKSLPYAFSNVYGKDALNLDENEMEDYESGHREYIDREEKEKADRDTADKNFAESFSRLSEYIKAKKLDENRSEALWNGIVQLGENFVMGSIPDEVFDLVYKGLNYDDDVQEAADTGYVEARNDVIEPKMKAKTEGTPVPNLSSSTGISSGKKAKADPVVDSSFNEYSNITPVKGSGRSKRLI